ncbi:tetratricopeptide repeat protein [Aliamphritea hakodatensis]|uniref:tetratricopeptide repeat protein n=1 Tax=Aliamphritea hakodatensis TaxID=2895352 RepID=UPI0022FD6580|nr:hypothetical protein [Aliamphritea hakodatensis]
MEYCKYHPVSEATYRCAHCNAGQCDHCVDASSGSVRCFVCRRELENKGPGDSVVPFWRRLDKCFSYPMTMQALLLTIIASVVSVIGALAGGLQGFIILLLVTAVTTKYAFLCLQQTAAGNMSAPDVSEAFLGGVKLIIHIIIILLGIVFMVLAVANVLGPFAAIAFSAFWLCCLPAVFINYARFEEISSALNPVEVARLVLQLRGAYFLLLLFITIMMLSVGTLNQLFDGEDLLSAALQSVVSYYYWIVIFHLMGYLLFQKQRALGYVSRLESDGDVHNRSEKQHTMARIGVLAKEGMFSELSHELKTAVKKYPGDIGIYDRYFDYLCALHKTAELDKFWLAYLECLSKSGSLPKVAGLMLRILQFAPDYLPASAEVRFKLAGILLKQGKPALSARLINRLHRDHPGFDRLPEAYFLMADALEELPEKQVQAEKCRLLANKLKARPLATQGGGNDV